MHAYLHGREKDQMNCFVIGMVCEFGKSQMVVSRSVRLASVHYFNMNKQPDYKPAFDIPMVCPVDR